MSREKRRRLFFSRCDKQKIIWGKFSERQQENITRQRRGCPQVNNCACTHIRSDLIKFSHSFCTNIILRMRYETFAFIIQHPALLWIDYERTRMKWIHKSWKSSWRSQKWQHSHKKTEKIKVKEFSRFALLWEYFSLLQNFPSFYIQQKCWTELSAFQLEIIFHPWFLFPLQAQLIRTAPQDICAATKFSSNCAGSSVHKKVWMCELEKFT